MKFSALILAAMLAIPVSAHAENAFNLGVEGFRDNYREPGPGLYLDSVADYGSVIGAYIHSNQGYFSTVEGRFSYGKNDYSSVSGTISGTEQYESELRLMTGAVLDLDKTPISVYTGLGARLFYDNGKNTVTSLGLIGYDRRISQFYIPVGAKMTFNSDAWTYTPMVEYDQLFYGHVNSRLQNVGPGFYNIENNQRHGYGIRGEFMVGHKFGDHLWEFGPFARYWHIPDSDITTDPSGNRWVEPNNTRTQIGAQLRINFK